MRSIYPPLLVLCFLVFSSEAFSQCWPNDNRDRSAVELTACFMAEIQICEEKVPGFKDKVTKDLAQLTSASKYKEIAKSKDFERIKQDAYRNLANTMYVNCSLMPESIKFQSSRASQ